MISVVRPSSHDDLHEINACPLCGSGDRHVHSHAQPNLYSEKLAGIVGKQEAELIERMPNVACLTCGLIYKSHWFPRSILESLFCKAVPCHPKGWDALADRFDSDSFFSEVERYELALRQDNAEQVARWRRALHSIIDSIPALEGHPERPAIDKAIQTGDCAGIREKRPLIVSCMKEPAPFKRFAGFRSRELWDWCIAEAGPVHSYAEVGCPLWGLLPIARTKTRHAVFLSRSEPNYWTSNCRMNGRSCTTAIQVEFAIEESAWNEVASNEFDLIGVFQYLDHLENPMGFMEEIFARARSCALILDEFSQPTAIQHFTGWTREAIDWMASKFGKRVNDGFHPIRNSGNRLYLLT